MGLLRGFGFFVDPMLEFEAEVSWLGCELEIKSIKCGVCRGLDWHCHGSGGLEELLEEFGVQDFCVEGLKEW